MVTRRKDTEEIVPDYAAFELWERNLGWRAFAISLLRRWRALEIIALVGVLGPIVLAFPMPYDEIPQLIGKVILGCASAMAAVAIFKLRHAATQENITHCTTQPRDARGGSGADREAQGEYPG